MADFFIHITDLHLGAAERGWAALETFVRQVGQMDPAPQFIVNGGDIIAADLRLRTEPADAQRLFAEYARIMQRLTMPVYHVIGNHDLVRSEGDVGDPNFAKAMFCRYAGPRYQSFTWDGCPCLILDTWKIGASAGNAEPRVIAAMDAAQVEWVRSELSQCRTGQTVLLLSHHRVRDEAAVWNPLRPALRSDLNYIELAGCDHQNSRWSSEGWVSQVTGSFCGAWWDGDCVDTSPAGYAIVMRDSDEPLKHYYRSTVGSLAIASPRPGQIIGDQVSVEAFDPRSGEKAAYVADTRRLPPGWQSIEVRVGGQRDAVGVFRSPRIENQLPVDGSGTFEFETASALDSPVRLTCNGQPIGSLEPPSSANRTHQFIIPSGLLRQWNIFELAGDGVIRSPRLWIDGRHIDEPRIARLYAARPSWFGAGRELTWDISGRHPKTPWRYPESAFYFPAGPLEDQRNISGREVH
jgi:hypothetical protein